MGEPPRLETILVPWEQEVAYFVTMSVKARRKILANKIVYEATRTVVRELRDSHVLAGVLMPDHVHFIVLPTKERELPVGDFSNAFKRLLRKRLGEVEWQWQRGCFDRLLRSSERTSEKRDYIRDNPVRAGLVKNWSDWPYSFGFDAGLDGKLTASPTNVGARAAS